MYIATIYRVRTNYKTTYKVPWSVFQYSRMKEKIITDIIIATYNFMLLTCRCNTTKIEQATILTS